MESRAVYLNRQALYAISYQFTPTEYEDAHMIPTIQVGDAKLAQTVPHLGMLA